MASVRGALCSPRLSSPRYLTPSCREGGTTIILSTLTPTPGLGARLNRVGFTGAHRAWFRVTEQM